MKDYIKEFGGDFKDIIEKTTSNVSWEEYESSTGKVSYPFWCNTLKGANDTYADFLEWFEKQRAVKTKSLVGIIKPMKPAFYHDSTTKDTVVSDYKSLIKDNLTKLGEVPKTENFEDKTGVVKPKKNDVSPKKRETTPKSTSEKKGDHVVSDMTGVVKPKKNDVKAEPVEKIKDSKPSKGEHTLSDQTGVVDPKTTFGGDASQVTVQDLYTPFEPIIVSKWGDNILDMYKKLDLED